jgi:dynein heavy chain
MRLWVNESTRVFADRLINDGDRNQYKGIIAELLSKNFKMSPDMDELFEKLKFSDLLKLDAPTQLYEYNTDKAKLLK